MKLKLDLEFEEVQTIINHLVEYGRYGVVANIIHQIKAQADEQSKEKPGDVATE